MFVFVSIGLLLLFGAISAVIAVVQPWTVCGSYVFYFFYIFVISFVYSNLK